MGDLSSSEGTWEKMEIAKSNNKWISDVKSKFDSISTKMNTSNLSVDKDSYVFGAIKKEKDTSNSENYNSEEQSQPESTMPELDPLEIITDSNLSGMYKPSKKHRRSSVAKPETPEERTIRLSKMSAYAAKRLANETPEQRSIRLKRMTDYAAKRLAQETSEQRAKRLARMSEYAAKRLANETPEQRRQRLSRMCAYAARRQALKKTD